MSVLRAEAKPTTKLGDEKEKPTEDVVLAGGVDDASL